MDGHLQVKFFVSALILLLCGCAGMPPQLQYTNDFLGEMGLQWNKIASSSVAFDPQKQTLLALSKNTKATVNWLENFSSNIKNASIVVGRAQAATASDPRNAVTEIVAALRQSIPNLALSSDSHSGITRFDGQRQLAVLDLRYDGQLNDMQSYKSNWAIALYLYSSDGRPISAVSISKNRTCPPAEQFWPCDLQSRQEAIKELSAGLATEINSK